MPNRNAHIVLGALAGGALGYYIAKQAGSPNPFAESLGAAVTGAAIATLPDLLEPATNPRHRGTAHSLTAGIVVASGLARMGAVAHRRRERAQALAQLAAVEGRDPADAAFKDCLVSGLLLGLIPGFLSHLAADATTPACLPPI